MGLFDLLMSVLVQPMGLIVVDYNKKFVNETIEWADELYSRCGDNVENAFVCLVLCGSRLVGRFYYTQDKEAFCNEVQIADDIHSLEDELLQSEQFKELKKTGCIIIKKY